MRFFSMGGVNADKKALKKCEKNAKKSIKISNKKYYFFVW